MYSRVIFPPGVRFARMKEPQRTTPNAYFMDQIVADRLRDGNTWCVWNVYSGVIIAIFYHLPNQHGWSASEAHAKSFLNRYSPVNPFELDLIP